MSGPLLRAAKVAVDLARRPQDIGRYVAHNLVRRSSPLDLELPWMPYSVIDYLSSLDLSEALVHEYGAGGSTLFLARRANVVVSVESSADWHQRLSERLSAAGLNNVDLRHADAAFDKPDELQRSEFWQALPTGPADLIIIDSEDHHTGRGCRPQLFAYAEQQIRPGGTIVVDDAHRYTKLRSAAKASSMRTFRGAGPGRTYTSLTDVYQY